MMTFQIMLGASLVALLILNVCGLPAKGSKSPHQGDGVTTAVFQGAAPSNAAHVSSTAPLVKGPSPSYPVQQPAAFVGMDPMTGVYTGSVPVQAGPYGAYAIPASYSSDGSQLAGYYDASQQAGAAQPISTEWVVAPLSFEEASTNAEDIDSLLPAPQPLGPTLQSGETSNIVKEAELGHYQRETEESGFPAAPTSTGLGGLLTYPLVPLPYSFPYPYPGFDYRLLFGQYPPGTYTTFSRNHERGRDHSKEIHYLKEHVIDTPGTPQNPGLGQQKFFPTKP